jgi:hypothetical protein
VQRAAFVTVGGDFGKTLTHDGAVPGLQMVERGQLARRQILGKILYDRCIRRKLPIAEGVLREGS